MIAWPPMPDRLKLPPAAASALLFSSGLLVASCQPGMSTTPPVAAAPGHALGLPVYLSPEPTVVKVEDPDGRPIAMTLEHNVRDVLEEAGFKLVTSPEAAGGLTLRLVLERVGLIHADLFIHGAQACGVRLDAVRGDTVVASAHPEVECLSTSAYYGMLPRDAAVVLVNNLSHAPSLLQVAEALRSPAPPQ